MITLHTFGPAFGQPDPSPFVMKAMALLNLSAQPYTTDLYKGGTNLGPKGKRPFIVDDGVTVADSTLIRIHLEKKYGLDFDAHLTLQQKAVTWAVEKMCEEHLYFAAVYFRWMVVKTSTKALQLFSIKRLRCFARSFVLWPDAKREKTCTPKAWADTPIRKLRKWLIATLMHWRMCWVTQIGWAVHRPAQQMQVQVHLS